MNLFQKYVDYLKDNPEGYWFKRKIWGWGWTPATWQGWLVIIAAVGFIFWRTLSFEKMVGATEPTGEQVFWFIAQIAVVALLLIIISWRTGEPPKWQWGVPKKSKSEE